MTRPEIIKGPVTLTDGDKKQLIWRLKCPGCGIVGIADVDQMRGRVSILCDCGYHETHELVDEDFRPARGGKE